MGAVVRILNREGVVHFSDFMFGVVFVEGDASVFGEELFEREYVESVGEFIFVDKGEPIGYGYII